MTRPVIHPGEIDTLEEAQEFCLHPTVRFRSRSERRPHTNKVRPGSGPPSQMI
jgi:hypothetical protein